MVRQAMPFGKSSKLSDDYNPEKWKNQPEGRMGDYGFEESAGSAGRDTSALDKMFDEVTSKTPKEFIAKYGQESYNQATNFLVEGGYGTISKDKVGNTTAFKISQGRARTGGTRITSKSVLQERKSFIDKMDFSDRAALAASKTSKVVTGADKPPELQRATRGMGFDVTGQIYTEKYIPGVTDVTDSSGDLKDKSVFFEGEQSKTIAGYEQDVRDLETVIDEMNKSGTYDTPITELRTSGTITQKEVELAKGKETVDVYSSSTDNPSPEVIARRNKARLRLGLEPKIPSQSLVNLDIKESTIGDYYYNQLISAQVKLDQAKLDMGVSKTDIANQQLVEKALPNVSQGDLVATTEQVNTPRVTKENPRTNVTIAEDTVRGVVNRTTAGGKDSIALQAFRGKPFDEQPQSVKNKILKNASFIELERQYKVAFSQLGEDFVKTAELARGAAINDVDNMLLSRDNLGWNLKKPSMYNTKATIKNLVEDLAKKGSINTRPGTLNTGMVRDFDYDMGGITDQSSSSRPAGEITTGIQPAEGYSTSRRTVQLPGESAKQAGRRNAVLARLAGWDPKKGTWMSRSDIAKYESSQTMLRSLVNSGQINPNDIAWSAISNDISSGTYNPDDITKYIKPSAANDTSVSALKEITGKSTNRVKPSNLNNLPEVKRAVDTAPTTPDTTPKITIKSLTDAEIQRLPAYQDALDALVDVDITDAAKSKIAVTRTRQALEAIEKRTGIPEGLNRMLNDLRKGEGDFFKRAVKNVSKELKKGL